VPLAGGQTLGGLGVDAVVAKARGPRGEAAVVRRDQAPFTRGDVLHGMEAEGGEIGLAAHGMPGHLGTQRMGGVLDDGEAARAAQRGEGLHVAGMAGEVHAHHGAGARPDARGHGLGIDVERVGPHVGKDRDATLIEDRVGGGRERQGRDDDLVARPDSRGEDGGVQGGGAGRHRDGEGHVEARGEGTLELGHAGAGGDPVAAQALHHGRDVVVLHELAAVRQQRVPDGGAAVDGEHLTHR
jgi:hypothetical protein